MIHNQEGLQGSDKADYKRDVVDVFYGSMSYSELTIQWRSMVLTLLPTNLKKGLPTRYKANGLDGRWH